MVAILIASWVVMSESLQDNDFVKSHEILMRWLVVSSYSLSAVFAFIAEHCCGQRSRPCRQGRSLFCRSALYTFGTGWITLWFAGYLWYLSLRETSVALNNSLYQSQCIFVYVLSVCLLGEWITTRKSIAIIISLGGVFLISFGTNSGDGDVTNNLQGIISCLVSAFLFAIYEVTVKVVEEKHHDKNYSLRDSMYFLGYCGIWCLFTGPILIYTCDRFG